MQVHSLASLSGLRILQCKPAAAALIRSLVWEPPYAMGAALKRQNKEKEGKRKYADKDKPMGPIQM